MSKQRFSNNRKSRENRRTAGFTMTEILLVVAILAVLFGVTAVGLVQMQKELRQKELDSKAETIYMVAQNRLTELAASGRSDLYDPKNMTISSLWSSRRLIPKAIGMVRCTMSVRRCLGRRTAPHRR